MNQIIRLHDGMIWKNEGIFSQLLDLRILYDLL